MFWEARGESRVGSHVNSHLLDILVVPWVPNKVVCLAYDIMRVVGHMQGLQEPFSRFFYFFKFCLVLPKKTVKPAGGRGNATVGAILDPGMHPS